MSEPRVSRMYPGIWRVTLGEPESRTPATTFAFEPAADRLAALPAVDACPIAPEAIVGRSTHRGYVVTIPLADEEQMYGWGLQLLSLNQRGKKKTLRVNSDPTADTGDSHAPTPFYVSSAGYGVFIDSLRYVTVYGGCTTMRSSGVADAASDSAGDVSGAAEMYLAHAKSGHGVVEIEIPYAKGVDIYLFAGPDTVNAVRRYNLFSGGGRVPTLWGLGVWYRCKCTATAQEVVDIARSFREADIPCDVIGLEPYWQAHCYSCSHTWNTTFPDPKAMADELAEMDYRLSVWTHAYTHPTSPIYNAMLPHSGDHLVWEGLVPDWADPEARRIYADFIEKEQVDAGVDAHKIDECDNSDYISSPWSYPETTEFGSGLDGDQMHSAYGRLYQEIVQGIYDKRNVRTYGQVRSAHAFEASLPYVLYSDLYDHQAFIRGVVTSGFSGLLWTPELRDAKSEEDLIRRVESVVFSPQALVNAWFIQNPPWLQWDTEKNNVGELAEDREELTEICRRYFRLRMRLIPYLYSAFYDYYLRGTPPFRALVMDDPSDPNLWNYDTAYMMGDRMLVAPVTAGVSERDVYLPRGDWRDFWTGDKYEGGRSHHFDVPLDRILVFVKDNTILPLAEPAQSSVDPSLMSLTVAVYGSGEQGITLYEDDTRTNNYLSGEYNTAQLTWDPVGGRAELLRDGGLDVPRYEVRSAEVYDH